MEVIALKGSYHSRKEAIAESMACVSLTPDVFIVKRIRNISEPNSYLYWVCRPIRNGKDSSMTEWIMEFSDDVEVISRRDFAKYND